MITHLKRVSAIVFAISLLCNSFSYSQIYQEWVSRYDGLGHSNDIVSSMTTDSFGNIYITGRSQGAQTKFDCVTIKYSSDGKQQWISIYNGFGNWTNEIGNSITVDGIGNVYVAGGGVGDSTGSDYLTIKYNADGQQQWVAKYNGTGNSDDDVRSITVDRFGYVYVTGASTGIGTDNDFATLKYSPTGQQLWVSRYNGPGNYIDIAFSIKLDSLLNVYVSGSRDNGSNSDFATIKYNNSGQQQWLAIYSGPSNGRDVAQSMTVDSSGNVYVTGDSYGGVTSYDYATIKYSTSGQQLWVARYNGTGNSYDEPRSITVDKTGNVYVTGGSKGIGTLADYATVKYNTSGQQLWAARYNNPRDSSDDAYSIAVDTSGNVYVAGSSHGIGTSDDFATIKYNAQGVEQWITRFNGPANYADIAYSLVIDKLGSVYVAGVSSGVGTSYDFTTVKYSTNEPPIRINLVAALEGVYYPLFNQHSRRDTVEAYLASSQPPFNIVDSSRIVIDSLNFSGLLTFRNAPTDVYYLVLKHLNSIETWSKPGGTLFTRDLIDDSYDYTTSALQAYGNNLKLKGGKYCIISGDVSQDGFIDGSDFLVIDNDAYNFASGRFLPSDLNGDGFTDALDMQIGDNNRSREVIRP